MAGLTILKLNNPGAIEDGPFARSQPGYAGGGGRFARFETPEAGIAAQENLLRTSKGYRGKSISGIISRYAPVSEENPPEAVSNYVNYVAQTTGIDPTKPVPPDKIPVVARAMREFETGKGKKKVAATGDGFIDSMATAFGIPTREYKVDAPKSSEDYRVAQGGNFPIANPGEIDNEAIRTRAAKVPTSSDFYTNYLESATEALRQNAAQVVDRQQKIVGTKRNLVNDFATREAALEAKIKPLMARKEALLAQLDAVDNMNPLDRRLKSIFNPDKYDPRLLRGKLERINTQINGYEENYKTLNDLRAGVANASIDAESADAQLLNVARQATVADLEMVGQVVGATKAAALDQLFPFETQFQTLKLQEAAKSHLLGTLTLEKVVDLANKADASPDGTVTIDGIKLTSGELQSASRALQTQDLSFRSMVNSFKMGDMQTADQMESYLISHMSEEQLAEVMKNGGKYNGYQLSLPKLAQAADAAKTQREQKVEEVVNNTAVGLSRNILKNLKTQMDVTGARLKEMFGNIPGEYNSTLNAITTQTQAWTEGLNEANKQGVGVQYIAKTVGVLNSLQELQDKTVTEVAKKWGGGNASLTAVADAYLRGNPLSGDAAVKGLIAMARSGGLPNGVQLQGAASQAFQVAKATVLEWDNPQAGDSFEAIMQGGDANKKEAQLQRLVQQRVGAIYADGLTDLVINDLPKMARGVHDPNNPNRLHPFARVSREDFIRSIQYGDSQGYATVAQKMGITTEQAKTVFSSGTDSPEWKTLAQKKGWSNGDFAQFYEALITTQKSETLAALDASHSAAPGFSPAKAFIDFLGQPEVTQQISQAVSGYGQGSFGSFIVSSSAGGGFLDAWNQYGQSMGSVYTVMHSKTLQERIKQQRSLIGDPWVRMNAVVRAAGLTPQESQALLQAVKPLASVNEVSREELLGARNPAMTHAITTRNFDNIASVLRNTKFDDPVLEKLRKKVDSQWDAMDALVGTVFDSVNE